MSKQVLHHLGVHSLAQEVRGSGMAQVVSLKAGHVATGEELRAFCRENLARYKAPKHIEIVPDLPKSAAGKIVRAEARALVRL